MTEFNISKSKRFITSQEAGKVPTVDSVGEKALAFNTADGAIYTRIGTDIIKLGVTIADLSASNESLASELQQWVNDNTTNFGITDDYSTNSSDSAVSGKGTRALWEAVLNRYDTTIENMGTLLAQAVSEAPSDSKLYARSNKGWFEIIIPDVVIPMAGVLETSYYAEDDGNFIDVGAGDYSAAQKFTFEIKTYIPGNAVWGNIFTLGGNQEVRCGILSLSKSNSPDGRVRLATSFTGSSSDGMSLMEYVTGYTDREVTFTIVVEGGKYAVWADGKRIVSGPLDSDALPEDIYKDAKLTLFGWNNGTRLSGSVSGSKVYGWRFSQTALYNIDSENIVLMPIASGPGVNGQVTSMSGGGVIEDSSVELTDSDTYTLPSADSKPSGYTATITLGIANDAETPIIGTVTGDSIVYSGDSDDDMLLDIGAVIVTLVSDGIDVWNVLSISNMSDVASDPDTVIDMSTAMSSSGTFTVDGTTPYHVLNISADTELAFDYDAILDSKAVEFTLEIYPGTHGVTWPDGVIGDTVITENEINLFTIIRRPGVVGLVPRTYVFKVPLPDGLPSPLE